MAVLDNVRLDQPQLPPEYFENPFPVYSRLRDEDPVYFSENWNAWILTRYEDCISVMRNWKQFSSAGRKIPESENEHRLDPIPYALHLQFSGMYCSGQGTEAFSSGGLPDSAPD